MQTPPAPLNLRPITILYDYRGGGQHLIIEALLSLNPGYDPMSLHFPVDMVLKDLFYEGAYTDREESGVLSPTDTIPDTKVTVAEFNDEFSQFLQTMFGEDILASIRLNQLQNDMFISVDLLFYDVNNIHELAHLVGWATPERVTVLHVGGTGIPLPPYMKGVQYIPIPHVDPVEIIKCIRREVGSAVDAEA